MKKIFNFLAAKVCFTFAVVTFSVLGSISTVLGLIYIWATFDGSGSHTLRNGYISCLILVTSAALFHLICFGLPRVWGRRWEIKHLRALNDQINGLSIPNHISTLELAQITHELEHLPSNNTKFTAIATSATVIIGMFYAYLMTGSMHNIVSFLCGGVIASSLYLIFTFLITEKITADVRRDARWLMVMREERIEHDHHAVSLRWKFTFIIMLTIISVIVTYGIATSPFIHSRLAVIVVFTILLLIAVQSLCMLIFASIHNNLKEIQQTAADLSEGYSAQFLSGSIDREFIETASGLYHASLKIIDYRDKLQTLNAELEEKVQKRTAEIRLMSITDSLTGCYNRGYLTENLFKEINHARRYDRPLSIIMCDLDHFKIVNDTYGHQAGDQVLREFVTCIKGLYRNDLDWVARYGGEEFIIVLPETGRQGAECMAERIRQSIAQHVIVVGVNKITITASFGITGFNSATPESKLNPETLINQADVNLYQAKMEGRDRIVAHQL